MCTLVISTAWVLRENDWILENSNCQGRGCFYNKLYFPNHSSTITLDSFGVQQGDPVLQSLHSLCRPQAATPNATMISVLTKALLETLQNYGSISGRMYALLVLDSGGGLRSSCNSDHSKGWVYSALHKKSAHTQQRSGAKTEPLQRKIHGLNNG